MKKSVLWALAGLVMLFAFSGQAMAEKKYIQARVFLDRPQQWEPLKELQLDIIGKARGQIDIVTDNEQLARIDALGYKTEIVHPDLTAFYQSRLTDKDMGGYMTLSDIEFEMLIMHLQHPNITTERISIGKSIENRDIWAFKISDNPTIDEDEPEVMYTAAIHAREVITPMVLFHFMNYLTDNYGIDPEVTDLVDNRELWFIPCLNPDGYFYNQLIAPTGGGMWRKNRRDNGNGTFGIDLNRNFGYMWGYDNEGSSPDPSTETYRGTGPFSEPETEALRQFTNAHDFQIAMHYHSAVNMYLWAYGYNDSHCEDHEVFVSMTDSMATFSHYEHTRGIGYAVNGGSEDWFYGEQTEKNKIFAITAEVGRRYSDGFWPDPSRIDSLVQENLWPNMYIAQIADNAYKALPPERPTLFAPDSADENAAFKLDWVHTDTINPAVNYRLVELKNKLTVTDGADSDDNWDYHGLVRVSDFGYDDNTGFYTGNPWPEIKYMQSKYPYTVQPNDTLMFMINYAISDGWDYAYVEISTDGKIFTSLEGNITTNVIDGWGHNLGNGITGWSENQWVPGLFDLSAYVGQEVYFRFSYHIYDLVYSWGGFVIDNISPVTSFESWNVIGETLTDTTYTVSGNTPGVYSYYVQARDDNGQWSARSLQKSVAVGAQYVCGDASGDGDVNLIDILYIIAYKYNVPPGPAPEPEEAADVNGDDNINLIDILYLIDYLYGVPPGPEPACN